MNICLLAALVKKNNNNNNKIRSKAITFTGEDEKRME
jgi:hypothetical protein